MIRIYQGSALDWLPRLPAAHYQLTKVSTPYYQARNYRTEGVVWGGEPGCEHVWERIFTPNPNTAGGITFKQATNTGSFSSDSMGRGSGAGSGGRLPRKEVGERGYWSDGCSRCGAWRGDFGREPQHDCLAWARGEPPCPRCFVCHQRTFFRAVWRVLRDDGVLLLNLDDSMAGSGKGRNRDGTHPVASDKQSTSRGTLEGPLLREVLDGDPRGKVPLGLKNGDLCGIPWRTALALQADGWYLRSAIVWAKKSTMPESVLGWRWERHRRKLRSLRGEQHTNHSKGTGHPDAPGGFRNNPAAEWEECPGCRACERDGGYVLRKGAGRPTEAYELIFLFTKTGKYFWDSEAIRRPPMEKPKRGGKAAYRADGMLTQGVSSATLHQPAASGGNAWNYWPDSEVGRTLQAGAEYVSRLVRRLGNAGVPAAVLESALAGAETETREALDGLDDFWLLGPEPLLDEHFAAFPSEIPRRAIMAATPEAGCCSLCGSPLARIVDRSELLGEGKLQETARPAAAERGVSGSSLLRSNGRTYRESKTLGWRETCRCAAPARPARVLDPCCGAATTLVAADRLGRDADGVELSPRYVEMGKRRLAADAGMFADVEVVRESADGPQEGLFTAEELMEAGAEG